jgi:uncharacterized membrane protein required for colicin V production
VSSPVPALRCIRLFDSPRALGFLLYGSRAAAVSARGLSFSAGMLPFDDTEAITSIPLTTVAQKTSQANHSRLPPAASPASNSYSPSPSSRTSNPAP